jgi:hypothetical protein
VDRHRQAATAREQLHSRAVLQIVFGLVNHIESIPRNRRS